MNDVAVDAEELKSVMTKLMMVPGAGEIEAVIAAVDHDDDQTVDYEEFELKMMERTSDVPRPLPFNSQSLCHKSPRRLSSDHIQCLSSDSGRSSAHSKFENRSRTTRARFLQSFALPDEGARLQLS